jgi:uncharacterized protein (DUF302 family)/uncharacterized membrane protein YidH (DUF202 family)
MADRPTGAPADYLAAERTVLAWIRTGLALMGFGFVVARFGLFLEALGAGQPNAPVRPYGPSFWFGTGLILLGVVVNVLCAQRHIRLVRDLNRGAPAFNRPSALALAVAVTLAVLGLAMAVYLISVRDPAPAHLETGKVKAMTPTPENGILTIPSYHSVDETVQKLEQALDAKGVKLFAVIDHSGEAEKAGIHMAPTKLLIFGNPKAGTPLMQAAPSAAIDLPLKILVAEDANGQTLISYNSSAYLEARHRLPHELVETSIGSAVETLAAKGAE